MIAIIDYKMGNVRSVAKAFESIGAEVKVTANKSMLRRAKALVLPGVGAFSAGMKNLRDLKLIPEIKKYFGEDLIKIRQPLQIRTNGLLDPPFINLHWLDFAAQ